MTDHTALLARLREAKEGSRVLGDAVLMAAGWTWLQPLQSGRVNHGEGWTDATGRGRGLPGPDVTTSLDAITGEVEARMWTWMTSSTGKSFVIGDCLDPESAFYAECATPALSLCYAFVEALSHE